MSRIVHRDATTFFTFKLLLSHKCIVELRDGLKKRFYLSRTCFNRSTSFNSRIDSIKRRVSSSTFDRYDQRSEFPLRDLHEPRGKKKADLHSRCTFPSFKHHHLMFRIHLRDATHAAEGNHVQDLSNLEMLEHVGTAHESLSSAICSMTFYHFRVSP